MSSYAGLDPIAKRIVVSHSEIAKFCFDFEQKMDKDDSYARGFLMGASLTRAMLFDHVQEIMKLGKYKHENVNHRPLSIDKIKTPCFCE